MAYKRMICCTNAGQTLPRTFVEKVLVKYPNAFGVALRDPSDGQLAENRASDPTVDSVVKTSEALKNSAVLYYFGNHDKGSPEDEVQPYPVLEDPESGADLVYAFVLGSLPGYAKEGSTHSEQWFFANDQIKSTLKEIYQLVDKNMPNVSNTLDKGMVKNPMAGAIAGPGSIVLVLSTGDVKMINKDLVPEEFTFGWTTDACDYKEGEFPAQAEAPKLPAALAARKEKKSLIVASTEPFKAPEKPAEKPVERPVMAQPPKPIEAPKTGTAPLKAPESTKLPDHVSRDASGVLWYTPPNSLKGRPLKKSYKLLAGYLPNGPVGTPEHWESAPRVKLNQKKVAALLRNPSDLAALKPQMEQEEGLPRPPHEKPATEPAKPASVPEAVPEPVKKVEQEAPITVKVAAEITDKFLPEAKAFIDLHSNAILDPRTLQEAEEKWPSFGEALGIKGLDNTIRWPFEAFVLLGKRSPEAVALLLMDYRLRYLRTLSADELAKLNPMPEKKLPAALAARLAAREEKKKVAM